METVSERRAERLANLHQERDQRDLEPRKRCSDCGTLKSLSEFGVDERARTGRQSKCRACYSAYKRILKETRTGRTVRPLTEIQAERTARRDETRRLFDAGMSVNEIAARMGLSKSTIGADLRRTGTTRARRENWQLARGTVEMIDNLVTQWAALAALVHDGRSPVLNLEDLDVDPERRAAWEKDLVHVGRAVRHVRKCVRKEATHVDSTVDET